MYGAYDSYSCCPTTTGGYGQGAAGFSFAFILVIFILLVVIGACGFGRGGY